MKGIHETKHGGTPGSRLKHGVNTGRKIRGVSALVAIGSLIIFVQAVNVIIMHSKAPSPPALFKPPENVASTDASGKEVDGFPKWISDYMAWHSEMRTKYPGKELFTNPDAPNLIIRVCLGLCGGLNDRLGQLPWDLYLANQTKRVFLISWLRPRALENFLVPNELDWGIPSGVEGWGFDDMKVVRTRKFFFADMPETAPTPEFFATQIDEAIQRAFSGEFKDEKVLVHRVLGHLNEDILEKKLNALGETDMIHDTLTFGNIFRAFFKPSPAVQSALDQVHAELKLTSGEYSAVHCRVRHPKARPPGQLVLGKSASYPADKTGLPFHGENKDFAVSIATHAIQCARTLSSGDDKPIYFFSDSNDLVQYMVHDLKNPEFLAKNASLLNNAVDAAAEKAVEPAHLVAREMSEENAHIDKQKGRPAPAYYATFVDLYLAMGARCMTYGIGYYAVFASKLSGIKCKLLYQEEEWGGSERKRERSTICTEETYKNLLQKS